MGLLTPADAMLLDRKKKLSANRGIAYIKKKYNIFFT